MYASEAYRRRRRLYLVLKPGVEMAALGGDGGACGLHVPQFERHVDHIAHLLRVAVYLFKSLYGLRIGSAIVLQFVDQHFQRGVDQRQRGAQLVVDVRQEADLAFQGLALQVVHLAPLAQMEVPVQGVDCRHACQDIYRYGPPRFPPWREHMQLHHLGRGCP